MKEGGRRITDTKIVFPLAGIVLLAYRVAWKVAVLFAKLVVFLIIQLVSLFLYIISYVFGRIRRKRVNNKKKKGEFY